MIFLSIVLYGYSRCFLSKTGAMTAALAFASMPEMFLNGQKAETEAVYTAFLAGSLLVWHWGYLRKWNATATWVASYTLLAGAALCKGGLQPPAYFAGSVGTYLLINRNLRLLVRPSHLIGLCFGLCLTAAWFVPYTLQQGWSVALHTWMGDTSMRFKNWQLEGFLIHLGVFPCEVFGVLLPWSLMFIAYFQPRYWRWMIASCPQVLFVVICVGIAFPTCWLPPEGRTRYFSPLFPCLAVMVAAVIESCIAKVSLPRMQFGWKVFVILLSGVMFLAALGIPAISILFREGRWHYWASSSFWAVAYCGIFLSLAWYTIRRRGTDEASVRHGMIAITCSMIALSCGYLTDLRIRRSEDTPALIARVKKDLPEQQSLVSFDYVDCLFIYHYGHFIDRKPWPVVAEEIPPGTYFCFNSSPYDRPSLPFPWHEIAMVSMERNIDSVLERVVVVGCRLPEGSEPEHREVNKSIAARH